MRRVLIALVTLGASLLASCGGEEPPPEGFHLLLRFTSSDPTVYERVIVRLDPPGNDQRFMGIEPMSYADGNIELSVDADGVAIFSIAGPYVAMFAEQEEPLTHVFDLEVWTTEDQMMRSRPPFVTVNVERSGEVIAMGDSFLPQWPLQLGGEVTLQVPCREPSLCTP